MSLNLTVKQRMKLSFRFAGALFAAVATLETLCTLCGAALFNSIYPLFLRVGFNGFSFLVMAVLMLAALTITEYVVTCFYKLTELLKLFLSNSQAIRSKNTSNGKLFSHVVPSSFPGSSPSRPLSLVPGDRKERTLGTKLALSRALHRQLTLACCYSVSYMIGQRLNSLDNRLSKHGTSLSQQNIFSHFCYLLILCICLQ